MAWLSINRDLLEWVDVGEELWVVGSVGEWWWSVLCALQMPLLGNALAILVKWATPSAGLAMMDSLILSQNGSGFWNGLAARSEPLSISLVWGPCRLLIIFIILLCWFGL